MVAASERHSTSPLPGHGIELGQHVGAPHDPGARRRRPRSTVRSVEPESITTSSSTRAPSRRQRHDRRDDRADGRLLVQRGQHDDDRRPAFAATRLGGPPGLCQVRSANHRCACGLHAALHVTTPAASGQAPGPPGPAAGCRGCWRTMSTARRVCRTSCARNTRAPATPRPRWRPASPPRRSSRPTPRVSPMKSLLDSAISTGHPVSTSSSSRRSSSRPCQVFLPKSCARVDQDALLRHAERSTIRSAWATSSVDHVGDDVGVAAPGAGGCAAWRRRCASRPSPTPARRGDLAQRRVVAAPAVVDQMSAPASTRRPRRPPVARCPR